MAKREAAEAAWVAANVPRSRHLLRASHLEQAAEIARAVAAEQAEKIVRAVAAEHCLEPHGPGALFFGERLGVAEVLPPQARADTHNQCAFSSR